MEVKWWKIRDQMIVKTHESCMGHRECTITSTLNYVTVVVIVFSSGEGNTKYIGFYFIKLSVFDHKLKL